MAVNKVEKSNGEIIIDITDTTATPDKVLNTAGYYGADGEYYEGTIEEIEIEAPFVDFDENNNLIVSVSYDSGYIAEGNTLTADTDYSIYEADSYEFTPDATGLTVSANKILPEDFIINPIDTTVWTQPMGTKDITENGTYNVYSTANVNVNVPSNVTWFGGIDAELWDSYTYNATFADLGYSSKTPSTSSQTVSAAALVYTTAAIDMTSYDYIIIEKVLTNPIYSTSQTSNYEVRSSCMGIYYMTQTPNSATALDTLTYNRVLTGYTQSYMMYITSSKTTGLYASVSYGANCTLGAPSFTSTSKTNTTLKMNRGAFNLRGNTTYASTTSLAAVDEDSSTIQVKWDIYKVKKSSTPGFYVFQNNWKQLVNNEIVDFS